MVYLERQGNGSNRQTPNGYRIESCTSYRGMKPSLAIYAFQGLCGVEVSALGGVADPLFLNRIIPLVSSVLVRFTS
jgi:hypothetical protein